MLTPYTPRQAARNRGVAGVARRLFEPAAAAAAGVGAAVYSGLGSSGKKRGRSPSVAQTAKKIYRAAKKAKTIQKAVKKVAKTESKTSKMEKRLRAVEKCCASSKALFVKKYSVAGTTSCAVNKSATTQLTSFSLSDVESFLSSVPVFDQQAVTYSNVDFTSQTSQTFYHIKGYSKVTYVNNNAGPVRVNLYLLRPKVDSSLTPTNRFSAGVTDQGGAVDDLNAYIMEYEHVKEGFANLSHKVKVLQPGQSISMSHSSVISYDPSEVDNHNLSYTKALGTVFHVLRLEGVIGHDSTTTSIIGTCGGAVDYLHEQRYELSYDGGGDFKKFAYSDNLGAVSTGIHGSKPIAGNQQPAYRGV